MAAAISNEPPMAKRTSTGHPAKTQEKPQPRPKSTMHSRPAEKLLSAQYATTKVLAESATLTEAALGFFKPSARV